MKQWLVTRIRTSKAGQVRAPVTSRYNIHAPSRYNYQRQTTNPIILLSLLLYPISIIALPFSLLLLLLLVQPHNCNTLIMSGQDKKPEVQEYKFAQKPEEKSGWEGFKQFLWNSETSEFLGRTGMSWCKQFLLTFLLGGLDIQRKETIVDKLMQMMI